MNGKNYFSSAEVTLTTINSGQYDNLTAYFETYLAKSQPEHSIPTSLSQVASPAVAQFFTQRSDDEANKLLAMMNLEAITSDKAYEGFNQATAAEWSHIALQEVLTNGIFDHDQQAIATLQQYKDDFEIAQQIQLSANQLTCLPGHKQDIADYAQYIKQQITNLKPLKSYCMAGGYHAIPQGHAMVYRFQKNTPKDHQEVTYDVCVYNAQSGYEAQQGGIEYLDNQYKVKPFWYFKNVPESKLFANIDKQSDTFMLQNLIAFNLNVNNEDIGSENILELFYPIKDYLVAPERLPELYLSTQRSGSCSFKSIHCVLLELMGNKATQPSSHYVINYSTIPNATAFLEQLKQIPLQHINQDICITVSYSEDDLLFSSEPILWHYDHQLEKWSKHTKSYDEQPQPSTTLTATEVLADLRLATPQLGTTLDQQQTKQLVTPFGYVSKRDYRRVMLGTRMQSLLGYYDKYKNHFKDPAYLQQGYMLIEAIKAYLQALERNVQHKVISIQEQQTAIKSCCDLYHAVTAQAQQAHTQTKSDESINPTITDANKQNHDRIAQIKRYPIPHLAPSSYSYQPFTLNSNLSHKIQNFTQLKQQLDSLKTILTGAQQNTSYNAVILQFEQTIWQIFTALTHDDSKLKSADAEQKLLAHISATLAHCIDIYLQAIIATDGYSSPRVQNTGMTFMAISYLLACKQCQELRDFGLHFEHFAMLSHYGSAQYSPQSADILQQRHELLDFYRRLPAQKLYNFHEIEITEDAISKNQLPETQLYANMLINHPTAITNPRDYSLDIIRTLSSAGQLFNKLHRPDDRAKAGLLLAPSVDKFPEPFKPLGYVRDAAAVATALFTPGRKNSTWNQQAKITEHTVGPKQVIINCCDQILVIPGKSIANIQDYLNIEALAHNENSAIDRDYYQCPQTQHESQNIGSENTLYAAALNHTNIADQQGAADVTRQIDNAINRSLANPPGQAIFLLNVIKQNLIFLQERGALRAKIEVGFFKTYQTTDLATKDISPIYNFPEHHQLLLAEFDQITALCDKICFKVVPKTAHLDTLLLIIRLRVNTLTAANKSLLSTPSSQRSNSMMLNWLKECLDTLKQAPKPDPQQELELRIARCGLLMAMPATELAPEQWLQLINDMITLTASANTVNNIVPRAFWRECQQRFLQLQPTIIPAIKKLFATNDQVFSNQLAQQQQLDLMNANWQWDDHTNCLTTNKDNDCYYIDLTIPAIIKNKCILQNKPLTRTPIIDRLFGDKVISATYDQQNKCNSIQDDRYGQLEIYENKQACYIVYNQDDAMNEQQLLQFAQYNYRNNTYIIHQSSAGMKLFYYHHDSNGLAQLTPLPPNNNQQAQNFYLSQCIAFACNFTQPQLATAAVQHTITAMTAAKHQSATDMLVYRNLTENGLAKKFLYIHPTKHNIAQLKATFQLNEALLWNHTLWLQVDPAQPELRIYDLADGSKCLYKTQHGQLVDCNSPTSSPLAFYGIATKFNPALERFDQLQEIAIWYTNVANPRMRRIEFARYQQVGDHTIPLSFTLDAQSGKWLYHRDQNYYLNDNSFEPLLNYYGKYLDLVNKDQKTKHKILIPIGKITANGFKQYADIKTDPASTALAKSANLKNAIEDTSKLSQAYFEYEYEDVAGKKIMVPTDPNTSLAATIYLAHLYLAQKRYQEANTLLQNISLSATISEQSIELLTKLLCSADDLNDKLSANACAVKLQAYYKFQKMHLTLPRKTASQKQIAANIQQEILELYKNYVSIINCVEAKVKLTEAQELELNELLAGQINYQHSEDARILTNRHLALTHNKTNVIRYTKSAKQQQIFQASFTKTSPDWPDNINHQEVLAYLKLWQSWQALHLSPLEAEQYFINQYHAAISKEQKNMALLFHLFAKYQLNVAHLHPDHQRQNPYLSKMTADSPDLATTYAGNVKSHISELLKQSILLKHIKSSAIPPPDYMLQSSSEELKATTDHLGCFIQIDATITSPETNILTALAANNYDKTTYIIGRRADQTVPLFYYYYDTSLKNWRCLITQQPLACPEHINWQSISDPQQLTKLASVGINDEQYAKITAPFTLQTQVNFFQSSTKINQAFINNLVALKFDDDRWIIVQYEDRLLCCHYDTHTQSWQHRDLPLSTIKRLPQTIIQAAQPLTAANLTYLPTTSPIKLENNQLWSLAADFYATAANVDQEFLKLKIEYLQQDQTTAISHTLLTPIPGNDQLTAIAQENYQQDCLAAQEQTKQQLVLQLDWHNLPEATTRVANLSVAIQQQLQNNTTQLQQLQALIVAYTRQQAPNQTTILTQMAHNYGYAITEPKFDEIMRAATLGLTELKALNPNLTTAEISQWRAACLDYMVITTTNKQLELVATPLDGLKKELASTQANIAKCTDLTNQVATALSQNREYNPYQAGCEDYFPLMFEYFSGMRIRKNQATLIRELLDTLTPAGTTEPTSKVFQLIMAGGKTSVIISIMLELISKQRKLPLVLCHPSQYTAVCGSLANHQKQRYGKDLYTLEYTLDDLADLTKLDEIWQTLQDATTHQCAIIMKNHIPQLIELKLIMEMTQANPDLKLVGKLLQITDFIKTAGVGIMDECNLTLSTLTEVNIPNEQTKQFLQPERIELVQAIYELLAANAIAAPLLAKNQQENLTPAEKNQIINSIAEQLISQAMFKLDASLIPVGTNLVAMRQSLVRYLTGQTKTEDHLFLKAFHSWGNGTNAQAKKLADNIALAAHLLKDIVPLALTKSDNRDYGINPANDQGQIIPYLGVNTPASTQFGYAYLALCYQFQAALNHGITKSELTNLVNKLYTEATAAANIQSVDINKTNAGKWFFAQTNIALTAAYSNPAQLESALRHLNTNPKHLLAIKADIAQYHVTYYQERFNSNPINAVSQLDQVIGCSGTPWNWRSYHNNFGKLRPDEGAEGKIINTMLNREQALVAKGESSIKQLASSEPTNHQAILKLIKEHPNRKNIHSLIDVGGLLKNTTNAKMAKDLLDIYQDTNIDSIIFLHRFPATATNPEREAFVLLKRNAATQTPDLIEIPDITDKQAIIKHVKSLDNLFVIYDEQRSIGTDIALTPTATCLVTVDAQTPTYSLLQGMLRARNYFGTPPQTCEYVVTPTAQAKMLNGGKTLADILNTTIQNQAIAAEKQTFKHYFAQLDDTIRSSILNLGKNQGLSANSEKISQACQHIYKHRALLTASLADNPYQKFGALEQEIGVDAALQQHAVSNLVQYVTASLPLDTPKIDQLKQYFTQVFTNPIATTILDDAKREQLNTILINLGADQATAQELATALAPLILATNKILVAAAQDITNHHLKSTTNSRHNNDVDINAQQTCQTNLQSNLQTNLQNQNETENLTDNLLLTRPVFKETAWLKANYRTGQDLFTSIASPATKLIQTVKEAAIKHSDSAKYANCFANHVYLTENLHQTIANTNLSLTNPSMKQAAGVLIIANQPYPPKFILLSEHDFTYFADWIKAHHPADACLVNLSGIPINNQHQIRTDDIANAVFHANLFNGNAWYFNQPQHEPTIRRNTAKQLDAVIDFTLERSSANSVAHNNAIIFAETYGSPQHQITSNQPMSAAIRIANRVSHYNQNELDQLTETSMELPFLTPQQCRNLTNEAVIIKVAASLTQEEWQTYFTPHQVAMLNQQIMPTQTTNAGTIFFQQSRQNDKQSVNDKNQETAAAKHQNKPHTQQE